MIATLRELGIPLVAYSPIGRGWLSGTLHSLADIAPDDMRASAPRWQPDTFDRNRAIAAEVVAIASELGVTAAQLSLAWAQLAQLEAIVANDAVAGQRGMGRLRRA